MSDTENILDAMDHQETETFSLAQDVMEQGNAIEALNWRVSNIQQEISEDMALQKRETFSLKEDVMEQENSIAALNSDLSKIRADFKEDVAEQEEMFKMFLNVIRRNISAQEVAIQRLEQNVSAQNMAFNKIDKELTINEEALEHTSCGCTEDTLPHPRIVLIGSDGPETGSVGKSTFGSR